MGMMETSGGLSVADVMALSKDENGIGGGGMWPLFLFFLLAWGNGGGGLFGGGNAATQGALTRAELYDGLSFNQLENSVRGVQNGMCDGFYAQNTALLTGLNQLSHATGMGFAGVNAAIRDGGYETAAAIADSRYAAQTIGCETNRNIDSVKYEAARNTADIIGASTMNTRDIIESQNCGIQRVIDFMTNDKIETLRDKVQLAELQLNNSAQTQSLIHALRPFPQPAYITCSPYQTGACAVSAYA